MDELYKDRPRPALMPHPKHQYIAGYLVTILVGCFDVSARTAFVEIWQMGWGWGVAGTLIIVVGMAFLIPAVFMFMLMFFGLPAMWGVKYVEEKTTKQGRAYTETYDDVLGGAISAYLDFFYNIFKKEG